MQIILQKHCVVCEKDHDVEVEQRQYLRWRSGEHAQDVWPNLTPVQRESIISGVCSQKCWDKLWKEGRHG